MVVVTGTPFPLPDMKHPDIPIILRPNRSRKTGHKVRGATTQQQRHRETSAVCEIGKSSTVDRLQLPCTHSADCFETVPETRTVYLIATTSRGRATRSSRNVCARTVTRVFLWIDPTMAHASESFLSSRADLRRAIHSDPNWWWQSAPLTEWDGLPARRDVKSGWS